jgi:hypothetical protein
VTRRDRQPLEERLVRARREHVGALLGVAVVGQDLARVPVVVGLVVVPLVDLRHARGEGTQVVVEQVVGERAAEVVERLGDLRLRGRDDVAPGPAAWQRDRLGQRAVGVDGVAAAEEEIRLQLGHRLEDPVAADVGVDPPALAREVAAPGERHVAALAWRGGERADRRLRARLVAVEVLERHPVEDLLAGREILDEDLAGEVVVGGEDRAAQRPRVVEARRGGDVDEHPAGPVGARPDDPGVGGDVAALDAVGELGSRAQERGRAAGERASETPAAVPARSN